MHESCSSSWRKLRLVNRVFCADITLLTPAECAPPLETALAQNPHLTSLPAPKPEVLAPQDLTVDIGTAEIFRLPEVQKAIKTDFVVLPCDLICELDGSALLQSWMVLEAGLGGATGGLIDGVPTHLSNGGEKSGRRGGLGVWYSTKGIDDVVTKNEETDFIATTPLPASSVAAPEGSLRPNVDKLVLSIPTATLKDITEEQQSFPVRHQLLKRHGRIKMKTSHRDAHVYFFPYWIKDMMRKNESFDSVAEDVLGWWAKAGWQDGLGDKLGLRDILEDSTHTPDADDMMASSMQFDEEIDLAGLSSTSVRTKSAAPIRHSSDTFASRVTPDITIDSQSSLIIPPILAYVQPKQTESSPQPLIRRVDTTALLLNISLRLAKLQSISEAALTGASPSPFAHQAKVAHPDMIQTQTRVNEADSLIAENVAIESRVQIMQSVIGVGCTIGSGSRLTRCLLMEGAVVGENVTLTGCILGRRCKIEGGVTQSRDGDRTRLTECEVQAGFVVPWGSKFTYSSPCMLEGQN